MKKAGLQNLLLRGTIVRKKLIPINEGLRKELKIYILTDGLKYYEEK